MKCRVLILLMVLVLSMSSVFAGCGSTNTSNATNTSSATDSTIPGVDGNATTGGPSPEAATYKYIDPTAVKTITRIGGSSSDKWTVLNSESDAVKVKKIADLVNSGIARRQSTKAEIKPVNEGLLTGISLEFNDGVNTKINVFGVYKSAKKGNLGTPSKDLYIFEVISGSNKTFFTISSKTMVNYLLKTMNKDLPKLN